MPLSTRIQQHEFARIEEEAEAIVRGIGLPPCPDTLADIARELRREAPDVRRIATLVTRDVASSAGVIKTVNSPFFGLGNKARSVQQAIAYLGLDRTALLMAGLLLRAAFPVSNRPAMAAFWQSSTQLALTVSFLARVLGASNADEAHTFGLFREAGSAVLIAKFDDYSAIVESNAVLPITDAEKTRFGADHAVIGAVLARDWHLPGEMSEAILWHHAHFVIELEERPLADKAVRLIALGLLADRVIEDYAGGPADPRLAVDLGGALRLLNLTGGQFADLQVEALTLLAEVDNRPLPTMRLRSVVR